MSVLDPGEAPIESVVVEEPPVVVPPPPRTPGIADKCANCRRPLTHIGDKWRHENARIDDPACPAFCIPELYVEEPIRWGWLTDDKRSNFTVSDGRGSKGNGGMAA